MKGHIIAFFAGFLLDMAWGDPHGLPHPVCFMGRLISRLERGLILKENKGQTQEEKRKELGRGILLVAVVLGMTGAVAGLLLAAAYSLQFWLGVTAEAVMTWQILAAKSLRAESMKVYERLGENDLAAAREAVSMIVGRDTEDLSEKGVARAAIETVAENTSDGVIAPMLYTAMGGPVLGFLYKAVNTMDSMVGYKNERYLYFGKAAARLDDGVNLLPARISALLMILAAFLGGRAFSGKRAWLIFQRDRYNHASPNSAQTEAVCAGALGIRLAGDASYFGKIVKKPYIGDAVREVETEDIRRANRLMYLTAWLGELLCLAGMVLWMKAVG